MKEDCAGVPAIPNTVARADQLEPAGPVLNRDVINPLPGSAHSGGQTFLITVYGEDVALALQCIRPRKGGPPAMTPNQILVN